MLVKQTQRLSGIDRLKIQSADKSKLRNTTTTLLIRSNKSNTCIHVPGVKQDHFKVDF